RGEVAGGATGDLRGTATWCMLIMILRVLESDEAAGGRMKLKSVHVREFKSVWDSSSFNVGDVTCLVGKNESGKTALLEALYRLNPLVETDTNFDVTEDYPRLEVEDYLQAVEAKTRREHNDAINATLTLEHAGVSAVHAAS